MYFGILNINKPGGMTSHDVVSKARKILNLKRIGHTGTLDPAATGVLPLCLGKSTRLIQYLPTKKQYIAHITLGITTSTYDKEGEILTQQAVKYDESLVKQHLQSFIGNITQVVPLTSATHYKGQKLYKYAQKGIEITDLPSKTVTIYGIEVLDALDINENNPTIVLKVDCDSGTYIRSLANDLGKSLGYGAYLSALKRTMASGLQIDKSITLEELQTANEDDLILQLIINPVDIINLPKIIANDAETANIKQGKYIQNRFTEITDDIQILILNKENQLISILLNNPQTNTLRPIAVFI